MIGSDDDEFVTVDGIVRQVHNALTGGPTGRDRVKDVRQLARRNLRRQQGDQETTPLDLVVGHDLFDADAHALTFDTPLTQGVHQRIASEGIAADLGAEDEGAANRDLRHVHEQDVVTLEGVQRVKEFRPDADAVGSRHGHEKG